MRARARHLSIAAAAGAILLAGCSSAADKVTEQGLEQLIESQGGGNVDLDLGGDGSVSIQGEDGSSWSMGGAEVPDTWPADVPLPDEYDVQTASTSTDAASGGQMTILLGTTSMSLEQVQQFYADALSGWEEGMNMTSSSGGSGSMTLAYSRDGRTVMVTAGDEADGSVYLQVSHIVEGEAGSE